MSISLKSPNKFEVLVIGGGIIGLSVAVELARRGVKVGLFEKDQLGQGCSFGNAGWLTPCFALPLPMPGLFWKSLKWLSDPQGPLYIKPRISLSLMSWLTRFLFAMNSTQAQKSTEALVQLSQFSLDKYEKISQEYPEVNFIKNGLLMVSQEKRGLAAAIDELNLVQQFGVPGKSLTAEQVLNLEPALRPGLLGGVFFNQEAHVEPYNLILALKAMAKSLGVSIFENSPILGFEIESKGLKSVQSAVGNYCADNFVLATGSWSKRLATQLSLRIPVLGGKGYSMNTKSLTKQPQHPIMLVEKKIAITPRKNGLRIAGTLELVDQDFTISNHRVQAIQKGAKEFLYLDENQIYEPVWMGLRPCTPDGVPLIGSSKKISNLFLACGHQMLGLQSGYGTGYLVADLITTGKSDLNREVFNPNRF